MFGNSRLSLNRQQVLNRFHVYQHCFLHAGYKDILVRTMNAIIDSELLRTEGDDIFQGLRIGSAADDHRLVCGIAGHIHIRLVQGFYERGLSREK